MYVNVYLKSGQKIRIDQVKETETTDQEIIVRIEKRINRYCITQAEVIEQYTYGDEIHTIDGKE